MSDETVLNPIDLQRYAEAAVNASLSFEEGDTLIVQAAPAHRTLVVALAEAGYRAGAQTVDVVYEDPLVTRARVAFAREDALGTVSPWAARRFRELMNPRTARIVVAGESEPGYLDGIPPQRIAADFGGIAKKTANVRRAIMDLRARWAGIAWPTDYWAAQVYPEAELNTAKRQLAQDLLWFCRLADDDGEHAAGWLTHVASLARRAEVLSNLHLVAAELRGPGTDLTVRLAPATRWLGGHGTTPWGAMVAPNMPTEETFTSPHPGSTEGIFTCTRPLALNGRVIEGLQGEFRTGQLIRLEATRPEDRDFVANYLDSDTSGGGRRLGEVALVDSTSRIGQSGRTYFNTLIDENAAAHIAFGAGFSGTRATKPARNMNKSTIHLDVMIGSDDFEATGVTADGSRVPLIADGLWRI